MSSDFQEYFQPYHRPDPDEVREANALSGIVRCGIDPDTGEEIHRGFGQHLKLVNGQWIDWLYGFWRPLPAIIQEDEHGTV